MEVAIDNFESGVNAIKGGCIRIELCSALSEGGLTPSVGFLKKCKQTFSVPIFVMIRYRGGDFVYNDDEFDIIANDLKILKENGADGFVFGLLNDNKTINEDYCLKLINLAKPKPCTLHRAFDEVMDYKAGLETAINLGFKRILTSGQESDALSGINVIKSLIDQANNRIIIMPGAGINTENVKEILERTEAKEFHGSASQVTQSIHGYYKKITNETSVAHMVSVYNSLIS